MSKLPSEITLHQHRKLCRKIAADLATKQLDELFINGKATLDIQVILSDYKQTSSDVFLALIASHLTPSYQYVLATLLLAEDTAALDKEKQYLRLTKTHQSLLAALKGKNQYTSLTDPQLIEIALLELIKKTD